MNIQEFASMRQQARMMGQMFSNPSRAMQELMQRNMNEMINQQLADWQQSHPQEFRQCVEQFSGKNRSEQVRLLRAQAERSGINLDQLAMQYGIAL